MIFPNNYGGLAQSDPYRDEEDARTDDSLLQYSGSTKLSPIQEAIFQQWYRSLPINQKLAKDGFTVPSSDDPEHFYDFRKAFISGAQPDPETGHLPSQFKKMGHPRTVVSGRYTADEGLYNQGQQIDALTNRGLIGRKEIDNGGLAGLLDKYRQ